MPRMTQKRFLERLQELAEKMPSDSSDPEASHAVGDSILLDMVRIFALQYSGEQVAEVQSLVAAAIASYEYLEKWYA